MGALGRFWGLLNQLPMRDAPEELAPWAVWRIFKRYFLRFHFWRVLVLMVMGGLVGSVASFVYAWAGKYIADEVVQVQLLKAAATRPAADALGGDVQPAPAASEAVSAPRTLEQRLRLLAWVAGGVLTVWLVDSAGVLWVRLQVVVVALNVRFRLRRHLYRKMHALPMSFHDRNSPGYLMAHLFGDVDAIERIMMMLVINLPYSIVMLTVGSIIVLRLDALLGLVALAALPAYGVCYRWFRRRLRVVNRNLREREGRLAGHMANRVENFLLVKSFGRETTESIELLRQSRPLVRDHVAASMLNTCFIVLCDIIMGAAVAAVLWIGALRVREGRMTAGDLLLFYGAAFAMFRPASELVRLAGFTHRLRAVCTKALRVLDEPVTIADPAEPAPPPQGVPELRFDHVSLRYAADRSPALRDVSFTLPAGKTLCVMGPSGSGKTALAKLACRLYDVTEGAVRLDGTDIRRFRLADLCQLVGYVNQEPLIFDGTLAENIRYGSADARLDDVVAASQLAQIHDFIERLPLRYHTLTQERGLSLSGGQKQRVNLARTLLYGPRMLVLDDCTAALDAQTEARLVDAFGVALRGRTTILVSHRLSIALEADLVLVLDDGQVAEFGPPASLLARGGPFARLYREQYKGLHRDTPDAADRGGDTLRGA